MLRAGPNPKFFARCRLRGLAAAMGLCLSGPLAAQDPRPPTGDADQDPYRFPTANHSLLAVPFRGEAFFVETGAHTTWEHGQFGCVRTGGRQLHEGIDIRCLERDAKGEPTDDVRATADGVVCHVNANPGLSSYGSYIVLHHVIEGLDVYSLYAHLRHVEPGIEAGLRVAAGEVIATLGRSAGRAHGIPRQRAHLHFELTFLINDHFPDWQRDRYPNQRNDHGLWNGRNFLGFDPGEILRQQHALGDGFSFIDWIRHRPSICRVAVRATDFPWIRRYIRLVRRNPLIDAEGVAGFELDLTFNGIPVRLMPLAPSQMDGAEPIRLISVDIDEVALSPCQKLVERRGKQWRLTSTGRRHIELLTYPGPSESPE